MVLEQRDEARGGGDIVGERATASRSLGILAPSLDLERLVQLRDGERSFRIEPALEQCERDDQRAARSGQRVQRREMEIVLRGDGPGKRVEGLRRLPRRYDA